MKLTLNILVNSMILASASIVAGAALASAEQHSIVPEMLWTYVRAEASGQVPCPSIAPTLTHREKFANSLLIGDWLIRTEKGSIRCNFHQTSGGRCTFGSPGYLVIEQGDAITVYDIADRSPVEFEIRDGRHACRIGRRIHTHGDTIVPLS
ncbi:hypothetical protein [Brevundimonas sp. LPMIX5]|uniref:hypothetical protein n=1 Tax=Brevundimonas sp. LPMIX5 TaxID=2305887 RepID=UPI0011C42EBA|nr:hypothetical protein [Brevundimonas sp. LPMIX5]